jgi:hypothetical protein
VVPLTIVQQLLDAHEVHNVQELVVSLLFHTARSSTAVKYDTSSSPNLLKLVEGSRWGRCPMLM